jgi:hypothetical protein
VQSLSLTGANLSLSGGGGTIPLPNGIYAGSGVVPNGTIVDIPESIMLRSEGVGVGTTIVIGNTGFGMSTASPDGAAYLNVGAGGNLDFGASGSLTFSGSGGDHKYFKMQEAASVYTTVIGEHSNNGIPAPIKTIIDEGLNKTSLILTASGENGNITVADASPGQKGIQYDGDYSVTIATNPRSIPDVGTITAGLIPHIPRSIPEASALLGEFFFRTDDGKLCYKDGTGTVHPLY